MIGNNIIGETYVTKFWGIHLNKRLTFKNHITYLSLKVAKSTGLLKHELNRYLPEIIFKTFYISLIYHMV